LSKPLIVIKLGGAALTDKRKIYTAKTAVLRSAARQIAAVTSRFTVIIVHGAGSFGHLPVTQFGLSEGFRSRQQLRGLSETKSRLLEWELKLSQVLNQYRIPVIPLAAGDYVIARNGRIHSCNLEPLKKWMRVGCVPSTGGDIVPDELTGFSIVSGDQLAVHIATSLKASKLVFATDVDGIFDFDPNQNKSARLMPLVRTHGVQNIAARMRPEIADVTGGMKGKIQEASEAAAGGMPVFFVNLVKGNRLRDVVLGHRRVLCSELIAD